METEQNEIAGILGYCKPSEVQFSIRDNHFLSMVKGEKTHERVFAVRLFPLSDKDHFISILDEDKKEICMLENLLEFSDEQRKIITDFLNGYYLSPEILQIYSVKSKTNNFVACVRTDKGKCEIVLEGSRMGIFKVVGGEQIFLSDLSGNNYFVSSFSKLDRKSRYFLYPYLI